MSCSQCGTIQARETANTGRDEYFEAPITRLRSLGIDRDDDLRECPTCGTMFLWHDGRSFTGSGASDQEVLTRFPDDEASVLRAFVHRGDRAAEEVAALADRWLALPEATPSLVSRWVLKRDHELARSLVPRMLDALGRGDEPRRFLEAYASEHDAAFVKSELDRRPPAVAFESLRVRCRRLLCSICRAIPYTAILQALPPGFTPQGASPSHDAADCPECGSMFLLEGAQGWSRLSDYESEALRACLQRDGVLPVDARETVIGVSDRRRLLKVALAHGLKRDRELIRQLLPRLIRDLVLIEIPWLQALLSEFAGTPGDASGLLEAITQASRRSPQLDALALRCRSVLDAGGLSLLREGRWAEAVGILGLRPERAADFHNLAIARTRAGDPQGGLEAARKAVAQHLELQGEFHPDTLESKLVAAYALLETGDGAGAAEETRRAANAIRSQAGETHPFFADALLIEARRVAKLGDGGAAEALARRALFTVRSEGVDGPALLHREADAAAIGKLWRTAPGAREAGDVALWRMSIEHTLRRYRAETLDFSPSGDKPKDWVFCVPGGWSAGQAIYAARLVMADLSRALNEREPADASFLDASQARATPADPRRLAEVDLAALFSRKTWESTVVFSLVRGGSSVPLTPDSFARVLAALGAPDAPLLALGVDVAVLARARAHPAETLTKELGF